MKSKLDFVVDAQRSYQEKKVVIHELQAMINSDPDLRAIHEAAKKRVPVLGNQLALLVYIGYVYSGIVIAAYLTHKLAALGMPSADVFSTLSPYYLWVGLTTPTTTLGILPFYGHGIRRHIDGYAVRETLRWLHHSKPADTQMPQFKAKAAATEVVAAGLEDDLSFLDEREPLAPPDTAPYRLMQAIVEFPKRLPALRGNGSPGLWDRLMRRLTRSEARPVTQRLQGSGGTRDIATLRDVAADRIPLLDGISE